MSFEIVKVNWTWENKFNTFKILSWVTLIFISSVQGTKFNTNLYFCFFKNLMCWLNFYQFIQVMFKWPGLKIKKHSHKLN